ncbi:MAG TPA: serine/threonine-protein kinase [Ktedonosporobacter sp.]|nr:serine/threonine-protein kinase [Ktedonosporobacter sp.]
MTDLAAPQPDVDMRSFEGKTILRGSYRLQKHIGEGNFGAVFKSTQLFLGMPARSVAVKLSKYTNMNPSVARLIFADAFLLAQAMEEMADAGIRKHLVHVYDMGIAPEVENRGFIVMEYIHGVTLAEQMASLQRVPASLMLKWVEQICRALYGLHTLNPPVLHRDLKPDNLLLSLDHTVHIVDFGLAARLLERGYVPGVAGALTYMAPETTHGESVPASDVYSIGIMLYQGLTGEHPFGHMLPPSDLPERSHRHWLYTQKSSYRPAPPSSLNNTVPAVLDAIVLRCLEFSVHRRYQHAGELLQALSLEQLPDPPEVVALNEGRQRRAAQDLVGARRIFELALAFSGPKETRFALLRELGETLLLQEEYQAASRHLLEAWELTKNSAILRTRVERAALLRQLGEAYRLSGDQAQANQYAALSANEVRTARK